MNIYPAICFVAVTSIVASALAQESVPAKKMLMVDAKNPYTSRTGIVPVSPDCIDAKIEISIRNGEATFALKELQLGGENFAGKFRERAIEWILGNKNCRILISASPYSPEK